jgi:DNA helicase HerA-like ATPase
MGSSGSGKTVLLKRLIEEAALQGVPSLIIDGAGDMTRMSRAWSRPPEGFTEGDRAKYERFSREADVVVWTPFMSKGNPFSLPKLPDLRGVADDELAMEEILETAVAAALRLLNIRRAPSKEEAAVLKRVFRRVSKFKEAAGPKEISDEIMLLADQGQDEETGKKFYKTAERLVEDFVTARKADPRFDDNRFNEIGELLDSGPGRTRISVMNISGGDLEPQRLFVEGLLLALFSHIAKKHPKQVNGLVVIDEAKEFAPSVEGSACKKIIRRFATMARQYGYGLVLASQEIKSMDSRSINNCNTKFFGKHSSNAAIRAVEDILEQGSNLGISNLSKGQFYLKSETVINEGGRPVRVKTPWCLTSHEGSPQAEEILAWAKESAAKISARPGG